MKTADGELSSRRVATKVHHGRSGSSVFIPCFEALVDVGEAAVASRLELHEHLHCSIPRYTAGFKRAWDGERLGVVEGPLLEQSCWASG